MRLSAMGLGCCLFLALAGGCVSMRGPTPNYTKEHSRRADQQWWIKEDLAVLLAKHFAHASRATPDTIDKRVVTGVGGVLQICFQQGSFNGADVDGGVRAMNYFRKLYFDAGGEYWTWRAAVRSCPVIADGGYAASPAGAIPAGYR